MEKWYLFNVYTFSKSLCVINVGSPYGLHGDPIYIWYLYDQMWLVGKVSQRITRNGSDVHIDYRRTADGQKAVSVSGAN